MIRTLRLGGIGIIGLAGLVASVPSSAGAVTLGELYGRWSVEKNCPFYEIFIPGEEIYFGPERNVPLVRKAMFSLSGTVLTHRNTGNRGEKDTIRKYQVLNPDVPGTTGAGTNPMLVGRVFLRCR
jgi:hypothetical protein